MDPVSMIQTKRGGERPHMDDELRWWIQQYTGGKIPDYQMSAWLMAVCWQGMTSHETAILTRCMVESGDRVDWGSPESDEDHYLVDKHSSGGVGDKISLVLAPLAAVLGVNVPMMAGRGLGHTGGTIDKLESIPGYETSLNVERFQSIVREVGCSIVSPNQCLCPADRKLYALRDVTATVSCIPLQTASIMSKKIAENPQSLVLDVKYGRASFQSSAKDATALAHSMIATGEANGVATSAFLTRMDHPIGRTVGNWLEVYESVRLMKTGKGCPDLIRLVVIETAQMIKPKYSDLTWNQLIEKTLATLQSGEVYVKFQEMVEAHNGDLTSIVECKPNTAVFSQDILSPKTGFVSDIDALAIGKASVMLGAGRTEANQAVDACAGLYFHAIVGEFVNERSRVATIYTNASQDVLQQAVEIVHAGIHYSHNPVTVPPIVSHRVLPGCVLEEFEMPTVLQSL